MEGTDAKSSPKNVFFSKAVKLSTWGANIDNLPLKLCPQM